MLVLIGDDAQTRDGVFFRVTDAVDQTAPEVIQNPDNIVMGTIWKGGKVGATIVTNMDEIVSTFR